MFKFRPHRELLEDAIYEIAKMISAAMGHYAKKGYFQLDYTNDEIGKGGTIFINSYSIDPHDFSYQQ